MPNGKPEPPARDRFKNTLRGLAPDATTGNKGPIQGGSVPSRNLAGMGGGKKGRGVIVRENDTSDRLAFHFNPSEYNDAQSSKWGTDSVANRSRPKYTYKEGGERTLTFQLLLDEVGMGQPYNRVAKAIEWLYKRMAPAEVRMPGRSRSKKKKFKADVLLLIRGERDVFRCHLKDIKVREDLFAPNSTNPVRAWVDLTLVQNLDDDELDDATGV
jgi:hypothetical protein